MPRTADGPQPDAPSIDDHTVTVLWEFDCPDVEVGECDDPDCDPEAGTWWAACGVCDFITDGVAKEQFNKLWELAERHESDPSVTANFPA
ncbi:hypothetical protein ABZ897_42925 [Nonomuraea sp. NPDC046802]|uniref:hypothetical protein n=1 Tax=Nonomuraea sp. NPDC046802 TaxID=3154919 RepID=UPI0033FBA141